MVACEEKASWFDVVMFVLMVVVLGFLITGSIRTSKIIDQLEADREKRSAISAAINERINCVTMNADGSTTFYYDSIGEGQHE
jgi:hypothetical protein